MCYLSVVLLSEWEPVTKDHGLIEAPVETVVSALMTWHETLGIRYKRTDVSVSLAASFQQLPPLTQAKTRRLFVATAAGWTAAFQNGIDGSDPFPAMSFLAARLGVHAMRICYTTHPYSATIWEVYAPVSLGGAPPLHYRRALASVRDDSGWEFTSEGEPFSFENTSAYREKKIARRFTKEVLEKYLRDGFGLRPFDESFFIVSHASPAVLLQQYTKLYTSREYTLQQVKAGEPWTTA